MSAAGETGFISIFIILVILCVRTVRSVLFVICEIAVMHFKLISCDMNERLISNQIHHFTDKLSDISDRS